MSEIGGGGKNRGKQLRHSLKKKRKDGGRRKNFGEKRREIVRRRWKKGRSRKVRSKVGKELL